MSSPPYRRLRPVLRRSAVLVSAGAIVAALNFVGVGAPQPAFTAYDAAVRESLPSRSLPDRLDVQSGVTIGENDDDFLEFATAEAKAPPKVSSTKVCVSAPLPPGTFRQSSSYGMRVHPITGHGGLHAGVDLAAPLGTTIHAVASGTVAYTGPGRAGRSSELVIIDHDVDGTKFSSWYVHMFPNGVFVEAGQEVQAGEVIAEVGTNGNSTGPHLHLEIHTKLGVVAGKGTALGGLLAAAVDPSPTEQPTEAEPPGDTEEADDPEKPGDPGEPVDEEETDEPEDPESPEGPEPEESESPDPSDPAESDDEEGAEDVEGAEDDEPADIEIEEDDDQGLNDHTIDETISRSTGFFDPSSMGMLHDPIPFLRALGYGFAAPDSCFPG